MKLKMRTVVLTFAMGIAFMLINTWFFRIMQSGELTTKVGHNQQEGTSSLQDGSSLFRLREYLRTRHKNSDFSSYNSSDISLKISEILNIFENYEMEIIHLSKLIQNKHMQLIDHGNCTNTETVKHMINTNKLPSAALFGNIQFRNQAPLYQSVSDNLKSDLNVSLPETVYKALYSASNGVQRIYGSHEKPLQKTLSPHNADNGSLFAWQQWHNHIRADRLYTPGDPTVSQLLEDLTNKPVEYMHQSHHGWQFKIDFYLTDGQRALFKHMRFPRSQETLSDHFPWADYERHNAEIAAFHLDNVLGFGRVPPTAGRYVNVTSDIKSFATNDLNTSFHVSPAGNHCFYGKCYQYCGPDHPVCGRPELLEGSMQAYLPYVPRYEFRHPWLVGYYKPKKAPWEEDSEYCSKVRRSEPYNRGRRLLDLMDLAAFDFLTGNMDRHHYDVFKSFGNFSAPVYFDNGRAFGRSQYDEVNILAPVYQCCLFRSSTLKKFLALYRGPVHLSDAMRRSLDTDPLSPILLEPHLTALDRRVIILLKTIYKCVQKNGTQNVIIDDGF